MDVNRGFANKEREDAALKE
jgi:hypothetical protein